MVNINIPQEGATLVVPNGDEYSATVGTDGKLSIKFVEKPKVPTVKSITVIPTTTTARVSWVLENGTTATVGRDGKDSTGYGPWTSDQVSVTTQEFTLLIPNTEYNFTVSPLGGAPLSLRVKTLANATTPPVVVPTPSNGLYNSFGYGASVTGAANGDFNKWTGKKAAYYSTWADNGKAWSIDTANSEYGANSIARLGDYDLHLATQHKLKSNWAGAANGDMDATFRSSFTEYKTKWGNRKGHLFIGPFHEMNGSWYNWSVRNATDGANFIKTWRRMRAIFNEVFKNDTRFHLAFTPNRDSAALGVKAIWPGSEYVDVLCPDYYDFSRADTDAKWLSETNRVEFGSSPVGLQKYIDFAKEQNIPLLFQEWGQQFGDNPLFVRKFTETVWANRYTGTGSAAGKVIGFTYHNLQGTSPDPNAGGDFFIQRGGSDYSGRKNASAALRVFVQSNSLRQP